jgi:drug/metabolite transporter (DMT)-like permease
MEIRRSIAGDIGVWAALASAFLFGAGTPLAKGLLGQVSPWLLAGLLYAGSGLGLLVYRLIRQLPTPHLKRSESLWLFAAVVCGGGIAPVLLMFGLSRMSASHASLLLNAEAVLTTLLAWALFKEHLGRRIALGMALIVAGAVLLSWPQGALHAGVQAADLAEFWPALAVVLACAFWALDNNLTRKVAHADASWIACIKGLSAGASNLLLAFIGGAAWPSLAGTSAAMGVGFLAYGVSLALFVVALRHLGASRAGAYFSTAPFVGALMAVLLFSEPVTWQLGLASAFMACGVWLHLTESHGHEHQHEAMTHEHAHTHDDHHQHEHGVGMVWSAGQAHSHRHTHRPLSHTHPHFPDAHHRHPH